MLFVLLEKRKMFRLELFSIRLRTMLAVVFAWGLSCAAMAQIVATHPSGVLHMVDLVADLTRIPEAQQRAALSNESAVRANTTNLLLRRVLAQEAIRKGLDKGELVEATLRLARERVLSELVLQSIDQANLPNQQDIEAYAQTAYKANPKRFEQPEQIRVRHILIRTGPPEARQIAQDILEKLRSGAAFEDLAINKSEDPGSAKLGGDLGYFAKGRMVPSFEEAAFALQKPGDLSGLVETPFGFHIIKLEGRRPAGPAPYDQVKDTLLREAQGTLAAAGRVRERDRILKDLKVDDAALEAFIRANSR